MIINVVISFITILLLKYDSILIIVKSNLFTKNEIQYNYVF